MITEKGSMVWMSPNMQMSTNAGGSIGKAFSRMFSGESMFQNIYTAQGGDGLFNTVVTGPGKVVLQTMPVTGFAGAVASYIVTGK